MEEKHVAPEFRLEAFHCPHADCGVYAKQRFGNMPTVSEVLAGGATRSLKLDIPVWISKCEYCEQSSFWEHGKLVWPLSGSAPAPNEKMPKNVLADYVEADLIAAHSPRGAAALLRLAIENLCSVVLGKEVKDLNKAIGKMAKNGLSQKVVDALDVVRVTGNKAIHAGEINTEDKPKTVNSLFKLVNIIVARTIQEDAEIGDLFEDIPDSKKAQIKERDGK